MNELENTVTSVGNYNNIPTTLPSNTSKVNIISGLTLTKEADKQNWSGGYLTYIITIDNQTNQNYASPVITDIIDTTLVEFVPDSVTIDNVKAPQEKYSYNDATHTLTINLDDVTPSSSTTLTFQVEKKA